MVCLLFMNIYSLHACIKACADVEHGGHRSQPHVRVRARLHRSRFDIISVHKPHHKWTLVGLLRTAPLIAVIKAARQRQPIFFFSDLVLHGRLKQPFQVFPDIDLIFDVPYAARQLLFQGNVEAV